AIVAQPESSAGWDWESLPATCTRWVERPWPKREDQRRCARSRRKRKRDESSPPEFRPLRMAYSAKPFFAPESSYSAAILAATSGFHGGYCAEAHDLLKAPHSGPFGVLAPLEICGWDETPQAIQDFFRRETI